MPLAWGMGWAGRCDFPAFSLFLFLLLLLLLLLLDSLRYLPNVAFGLDKKEPAGTFDKSVPAGDIV